jgi:6-phosphogluconolactonase
MKTTRRVFVFLLTLAGPLMLLSSAPVVKKVEADRQYLVYIGTYTAKTASKGIYVFRYDANSGKLTSLGVAAETPDPSWVAIHPNGKYLYAVNEAGKNSMVSSFSIGASVGKLTLLNQMPALGEDPCYFSFDKTGRYLFVANYTSGNVVVFPIGADGKLGVATANVRDEGKLGPNKERQDGPHAHWVQASSDNRFVFVADLGLDRILVYLFNSAKGTLTPNKPFFRPLEAGAGPRHAAFSPDGLYFYVLSEMDSTVTTFAYAPEHGLFGYLGVVPMLPAGFTGRNDAAEIAVHANGKFLYASNRGYDSIALFDIDPATGKLTGAGEYSVQGKEPRHFAIDLSGNYLLAEDQLSDKIVTFRIDQQTGVLTPTGDSVKVPSPVCIAFLAVD